MYDDEVRTRAVELIEGGAGRRTIARELGVPEDTARAWLRAYAVGGAEAVLRAGATRRIYDEETKRAAVREHLERGRSIREVMTRHGIASESSLKAWCRAYRAGGAEALAVHRRGRKPGGGQAPASPPAGAVSSLPGDSPAPPAK